MELKYQKIYPQDSKTITKNTIDPTSKRKVSRSLHRRVSTHTALTLTLTLTSILVGVHTLLTHVQRYDDGASVVIPLAVIARGVSEVAVSRAVGTAFVPRHQVGREVDVRELTVSVEVEVRSLEGGVGV